MSKERNRGEEMSIYETQKLEVEEYQVILDELYKKKEKLSEQLQHNKNLKVIYQKLQTENLGSPNGFVSVTLENINAELVTLQTEILRVNTRIKNIEQHIDALVRVVDFL